MKEHPIIFSTDMVKAILDRKTQSRRVVTKNTSVVGEGWCDWGKFDFYAKTFANDIVKDCMKGGEVGSIAYNSLKEKGRAPLPWADHSVPNCLYLHVPYNWAENGTIYRIYPKWEVGDRLWVREAHRYLECATNHPSTTEAVVEYKAGGCMSVENTLNADQWEEAEKNVWRPSIHLHRWASRITLEITEIRVERLQEIKEEDIRAEGCDRIAMSVGLRHQWFKDKWNSINAKRGYGWDTNPWVWVISFKKLNPATPSEVPLGGESHNNVAPSGESFRPPGSSQQGSNIPAYPAFWFSRKPFKYYSTELWALQYVGSMQLETWALQV